jgi:hypothetical protein
MFTRPRPAVVLTAGLEPFLAVVVQIQKLGDLFAGFAVIQQQDRVCPPRNPVILALTTNTAFEFTAFCWGKKTRAYHRHSRIAELPRVNPKFGFRVTRGILGKK